MTNGQAFHRLLRMVAPFWKMVLASVLLGAATVLSSVGLLGTGAWIIAKAALHPPIGDLNVAIVGVRFFGIARGAFRYGERLISHDTTFRVLSRLRVWFYAALEPLAPARLQRYRSGDLLARIIADIRTLENFFVRVLAPPWVATLTAVLLTGFLAAFAPRLGLAWLVFFLLAAVAVPVWARLRARRAGQVLVSRRAALNAALVDHVQGLADALAYNYATTQRRLALRLGEEILGAQAAMASLEGAEQALQILFSGLGMLAVLLLGVPLVRAGALGGVTWVALVLVALSGYEAAFGLPTAAAFLESNLAAARRLFELVDAEPAVKPPAHPAALPAANDLRVEALTFRYAPDEPPALRQVSLDLPEGKRVAVVGPSGAGKSTLIALLLRFWEYDEGRITLGGRDLRELLPDEVRSRFAVVRQKPFIFSGTLRENLLLAAPDADDARLDAVMEAVRLADWLHTLPQGYDTDLGGQGLQLSGGQRQRLALARALLRDAPILLLDEPTANLDALTEQALVDTLLETTRGRSVLWVTHNLVGLEAMDEIVVLYKGEVAERGTHTDLLARGGLYRRLWDLQRQNLVEV
ncbi:MAG TPA: thiol reductant ABC exporter subunit CydC [Chloroflexi bacterium]|nr:thiol reductant ABC exporter subunit CydC [Chloroflexota bacterium]